MISDWFGKRDLGGGITLITEPHVDAYFSANMFHVRGRDADLIVDTGMGLVPLKPVLDLAAGKPVIAIATHIHLDHVGSLFEFDERAGPVWSAEHFATMPDEKTYAHEYRDLPEPVTELPYEGWRVEDYALKPAPLTRQLHDGDTIETGDRTFRVLHLPGHAPDQIGLFDGKDGLFFSGDAIYDDELLDNLPDSDPAAYRTTMKRIMELPIRLGLGGHGPGFNRARMLQIAKGYLEK
ncbi:MAG TPA: MBL fold metallo-hydrolase [Rhizobiaceae bacterium]|nr:MBL fold metallo-hydrolase [Rhizobiaceae bacterium]